MRWIGFPIRLIIALVLNLTACGVFTAFFLIDKVLFPTGGIEFTKEDRKQWFRDINNWVLAR